MKILLIANHLNTGGITSYLSTLSRGFVARGHSVFIASSGGDQENEFARMGVNVIKVPLNVKCEWHPKVIASALKLKQLVVDQKIDVIHAHTRSAQICSAILSALTKVPFVSTCHGFLKTRIGRRILPFWGRSVIAVSRQVRHYLINDFKVPADNVDLVPNGIEVEKFVPFSDKARTDGLKNLGIEGDVPVIGIVARLSDVKGIEYLVRAVPAIKASFSNVKCLIFGVGPMEKELKTLVHSLQLNETVHFKDNAFKPWDVVPLLDVFVVPSVQEGIGLSAMEAGACGVPVVASRVGGLPEVIIDGETGYLVPCQDPGQIAAAVNRLLFDPEKAKVMGQKAREKMRTDFSSHKMVDSTLKIYLKLGVASPAEPVSPAEEVRSKK